MKTKELGSVVDALIEAKLRRLEDQFQSKLDRLNEEIERLEEDNQILLKENGRKMNILMQKLSKDRTNDAILLTDWWEKLQT